MHNKMPSSALRPKTPPWIFKNTVKTAPEPVNMTAPDDLISLFDDNDQDLPKPRQEYCGHYDSNGFRMGHGCETILTDHYEKYEGNFFLDNVHGNGTYVIKVGSKRTICSGSFYCNDLEGYAEVIYSNGTFEGLFRNNRKFGPGVLTYVEGSQDVGMWLDRSLIRLSCVVQLNWVPKLARSAAANTYLLQFRKVIPVKAKSKDRATEILMKLDANENVLKQAHKLYNPYVRNPDSSFFNKSLYDEVFFDTKDCYIEVALAESDENLEKMEEKEECDCTCDDSSDLRRTEIVYEISRINNKIYGILQNIKDGGMDPISTADVLSSNALTAAAIESATAQVETLKSFKKLLREKLSDKGLKCETSVSTTKVLVTDLLAWNNEKMFIRMLEHSFLHKNGEQNVSFDVSKLLTGDRKAFGRIGKQEKICIEFLTKCSEGKVYEMSDLLRKHNLNPDLCDACGNTGITFAVARDNILIIKALTNFGANLDVVNDEGLTPLNLCMARYLAVQYGISDWQRAFLPEMDAVEEEDLSTSSTLSGKKESSEESEKSGNTVTSLFEVPSKKKSLLSKPMFSEMGLVDDTATSLGDLSRILKTYSTSSVLQEFQTPYVHQLDKQQTYIFNTACVRLMEKPTLKEIRESGKVINTPPSKPEDGEQEETPEEAAIAAEQRLLSGKLEVVKRTMACLLHYGSDPDLGQVPFPALVMAVFTHSAAIVEQLLINNANPNIMTLGENMTALHTVASLQPSKELVEVGQVLLRYKANPNCRASPTHWLLLNASILGHGFENELPDAGKAPLHLLCMRYDFLSDSSNYFRKLAMLLVQNGANGNAMFLGHSPLSLAVVRGNIRLVETLLDMDGVDPNQKLGRGMGVALTVLILKRYADVLYFDVCKVILDTLLAGRANPFEPIFDYGNAIDFMQRKHETRLNAERQAAKKQIEAEAAVVDKKDKKKKNKKKGDDKDEEEEPKPKKGGKQPDQVLMQNYLLERSREELLKRIQCQATKLLYEFMDEYLPIDDVIELLQYLTPEVVCSNIELLLREGGMSFEDLHFDTLYRLTYYVASVTHKEQKEQPTKSKKAQPVKSVTAPVSPRTEYYQTAQKALDMLKAMDINERPRLHGVPHPSVDPDEEKYRVCFYCCRKKGRELFYCPKCEMIYFCSLLCNKLCNKSKIKHPCGIIFYNDQKAMYDQIAAGELEPYVSKITRKLSFVRSRRTERGTMKRMTERLTRPPPETERKQEVISQQKLGECVEIMKKHIEALEARGDDTGSEISLNQLAREITEIAVEKQANVPYPQQSLALGLMRRLSNIVQNTDRTVFKEGSKRLLNNLETARLTTQDHQTRRTSISKTSVPQVIKAGSRSSLKASKIKRHAGNKRESVAFAAHHPHSSSANVPQAETETSTAGGKGRRRTSDGVKVIYKRGSSKTVPVLDPIAKETKEKSKEGSIIRETKQKQVKSKVGAVVRETKQKQINSEEDSTVRETKQKSDKAKEHSVIKQTKQQQVKSEKGPNVRGRSKSPSKSIQPKQKAGSEKSSFRSSKAREAVFKVKTKETKKMWATSVKRDGPTKVSLKHESKRAPAKSPKQSPRFGNRYKTKTKQPEEIKELICRDVCSPSEGTRNATQQSKRVEDGEENKKTEEETKSSKKTRLAHYWFHKSFIKKLTKLFPTLDFPKLLLPFACFAEGQLYYRFDKNRSVYCTNYSRL